MLISLNEIKKLVNITTPEPELFKLIGTRLVELEQTINLSEKYKNIKIVRVVSAEPIPETHLTLCQVDDGTKDYTQVVCGAPNVHKDMLAVWLQPGCIIPSTYGKENFQLDVRKLRGYDSHGMLSALDELDLGNDHAGIIEIDPKDAKPGDDFATVFGLNDTILDIENKSLTHRPDCFGIIGFAREVAGILGKRFTEPTIDNIFATMGIKNDINININIEDESLCSRYSCAVIKTNSATEANPYLTLDTIFLAKAGMRSVSKIVDATNIAMLMTGQPLHAFDLDKFMNGEKTCDITVRAARPDEKLTLLDGKTIDLISTDIVICSKDTPVALAGAMGGASTAIDENTKTVLLESAAFSLYHLRKTQMAHGIFSEAITRFTKGRPASETIESLSLCASKLVDQTALTYLKGSQIVAFADAYPNPAETPVVKITTKKINSVLGTDYPDELIVNTLENVGFSVKNDGSSLVISPLSCRTDIHIPEDIIEEVGRLLGFDSIPLALPTRRFKAGEIAPILTLKTTLRHILSDDLNSHEILSYSFISKNLLKKSGEDAEDCYEIVNSISPELQFFRPSITPSLLEKYSQNLHAKFEDFTLYEMNQVAKKSFGLTSVQAPKLETHLSFVCPGDFFSAKKVLTFLKDKLGYELKLQSLDETPSYLIPAHSATIICNDVTVGFIGELNSSARQSFKIEPATSVFEINLTALLKAPQDRSVNIAISKFPSVTRDLTFKTPASVKYKSIESTIKTVVKEKNLIFDLSPASIYRPKDSDVKNYSFHLKFSSPEKTLTPDEISVIIEDITKKVKEAVGAELV